MGTKKAAKAENRAPPDAGGWKKAANRKELDKYCIQDVVQAARECNENGDSKTLGRAEGVHFRLDPQCFEGRCDGQN